MNCEHDGVTGEHEFSETRRTSWLMLSPVSKSRGTFPNRRRLVLDLELRGLSIGAECLGPAALHYSALPNQPALLTQSGMSIIRTTREHIRNICSSHIFCSSLIFLLFSSHIFLLFSFLFSYLPLCLSIQEQIWT